MLASSTKSDSALTYAAYVVIVLLLGTVLSLAMLFGSTPPSVTP